MKIADLHAARRAAQDVPDLQVLQHLARHRRRYAHHRRHAQHRRHAAHARDADRHHQQRRDDQRATASAPRSDCSTSRSCPPGCRETAAKKKPRIIITTRRHDAARAACPRNRSTAAIMQTSTTPMPPRNTTFELRSRSVRSVASTCVAAFFKIRRPRARCPMPRLLRIRNSV